MQTPLQTPVQTSVHHSFIATLVGSSGYHHDLIVTRLPSRASSTADSVNLRVMTRYDFAKDTVHRREVLNLSLLPSEIDGVIRVLQQARDLISPATPSECSPSDQSV